MKIYSYEDSCASCNIKLPYISMLLPMNYGAANSTEISGNLMLQPAHESSYEYTFNFEYTLFFLSANIPP